MTYLLILWCMLTNLSQSPAVTSVELSLRTRGSMKSIQMNSLQTTVEVNGQTTTLKTSPRQWQQIIQQLNAVKVDELSSLPVNAERSSVDAAYITHLRVMAQGQTYESPQFDHSNPPRQLASVVKTLIGSIPKKLQESFK